ncbi:reverse transcriptase [Gossypium australe]|uniref:Reverse transcriptase n=1 Tax=Gossypium australe TaxID=47621 RepID=A0A5B6WNM2_9ROSI|nr:reverse transcriptase [Gossypium australe]
MTRKKRKSSLNEADDEVLSEEGSDQLANQYFVELFTSQGRVDMTHSLVVVRRSISDEINTGLLEFFKSDEIITALKVMNLSKAFNDGGILTCFGNDVIQYFVELFTSQGRVDMTHSLVVVRRSISDEINTGLLEFFKSDEIITALKVMNLSKAFNDGGILTCFGNDVIQYCLSILNSSTFLFDINKTNIILIPKVDNPRSVDSNTCSIISAFVPERLIIDNVILAYAILHSFKNQISGYEGHTTVLSRILCKQ